MVHIGFYQITLKISLFRIVAVLSEYVARIKVILDCNHHTQ